MRTLQGTTVLMLQLIIIHAFDEILYVLMNGVGFSVERQYISQLPIIVDQFHMTDTTITVVSKLGWAKALKELIGMLYIGQIPRWDLSKVRSLVHHSRLLVVAHLVLRS